MLEPVKILDTYEDGVQKFIKHKSVLYQRKGTKIAEWEMINAHNTVHIIVDNTTTQELLFVKQVRIPVLVNNPDTDGTVIECCAGIIDKYVDTPPLTRALLIAQDEIKEELGYSIKLIDIKPIKLLKASVGMTGTTAHLFSAKVTNQEYTGQQLSSLEDIEVIKVSYDKVLEFLEHSTTDATTMFLAHWWLLNGS